MSPDKSVLDSPLGVYATNPHSTEDAQQKRASCISGHCHLGI